MQTVLYIEVSTLNYLPKLHIFGSKSTCTAFFNSTASFWYKHTVSDMLTWHNSNVMKNVY